MFKCTCRSSPCLAFGTAVDDIRTHRDCVGHRLVPPDRRVQTIEMAITKRPVSYAVRRFLSGGVMNHLA